MNNKTYFKEKVSVKKEALDRINHILEENNFEDFKKDEIIYSLRCPYKNGFEVVLEVFTGEESIMCTAYLYDNKNNLVKSIESDQNICESYGFELEKEYYEFNIESI